MNANDKLAELINQAIDTYATMPLVNGCRPELKYFLADYLLANGVIVPPCKVGDTMYFDGGHFSKHRAGEIMERRVDAVLTEAWSTFRGEVDLSFDFKDFGKTVFLSREEAEKALREREGK